jgi:glycosyltransferase involved in cell wall biosynthesis
MQIVIYNINSFGGNYEYAKALFNTAERSGKFDKCTLLVPAISPLADRPNLFKILMSDKPGMSNRVIRQLHFVYRSFVNPWLFYKFLKKQQPAIVVFNDFDQLSSFVWSFFFRKLRKRHLFGVILHDPDRDHYFPQKGISAYTMKKVMSIMDVAFHHGYIPEKSYYNETLRKVEVPHGIYTPAPVDNDFQSFLQQQKGETSLIGILGNIRDEKNYELIIESLKDLPNTKLLIAGSPANSSINTQLYRDKIKQHGLDERVLWVEKFLTNNELSAAITVCDIISLYYKETFTSQSGILNLIAPFKKRVIVSNIDSSLKQVVSRYQIGILVEPGSKYAFVEAAKDLLVKEQQLFDGKWTKYLNDHSWENNIRTITQTFETVKPRS